MDPIDPDPRSRLLGDIPIAPFIAAAIAAHVAAVDPHGDRAYDDATLAAHVVAVDPHGDRAYGASQLATHVAASDPHGDRSYGASQLATHVAASDPHGDRAYSDTQLTAAVALLVPTTRTVTAGTGLTGGGDLSANRTFTVSYGTSSTTACVGNDSRLSDSRAPSGSASGDLTGTYPSPTVAAAAISLAKMANLAANSIIGNNTGSAATPLALTASQVKTLLAIASGDVSGLGTAAAKDIPATGNASATQVVYGSDTRLTDSRAASSINLTTATITNTVPDANSGALTGNVTKPAGSSSTTIQAGVVTLAMQASLAASSIIGNNTGSPATPLALTAAQVKTLLAIANTDVSGLGTMSTQAASGVAITGGAIDGSTIGATTATTGKFSGLTNSALTSGRIVSAGTSGVLQDDARFTIGGNLLTVGSNTSTGNLAINGTSSTNRDLNWQDAGVNRWDARCNNAAAWQLNARDSAGSFLDTPIQVVNASAGLITIARPVSITNATASTTTASGCLRLSGGLGVVGAITFDGSSGASLRVTNSTANASVATTLGSVGPTGSTAGNPQGWLRISVAGTDRYIPFW